MLNSSRVHARNGEGVEEYRQVTAEMPEQRKGGRPISMTRTDELNAAEVARKQQAPLLEALKADIDAERALLKLALNLLKRCREEAMPFYLRREIDDALANGRDFL
jgi:hypothetical protein